MDIIITIQTLDGRVLGSLDTLQYNIHRKVNPIYTMGDRSFAKSKQNIVGTFVLGRPINKGWLTSRDNVDEQVELLNIVLKSDTTRTTLYGCELMKDGYGASYKDLISATKSFTFVAGSYRHEGLYVDPYVDPMLICEYPVTKIDATWLEEIEDPHKGMTYNPYTDKWSFL